MLERNRIDIIVSAGAGSVKGLGVVDLFDEVAGSALILKFCEG